MDRCTCRCDLTEILLKTVLNTIQSISQSTKLKALADDKVNATEKLKFIFGRIENIVGKEENAGYLHFLLFLQFSKGLFFKINESWDCVVKS